MILVPQEMFHQIQTNGSKDPLIPPTTKAVLNLDHEMGDILQRPDLKDDEKFKLYQQTLRKFMTLDEQRKVPQPLEIKPLAGGDQQNVPTKEGPTTHGVLEEEVINSVPVTLKTKAKRLMEKIRKSQGAVTFSDKGELVSGGKVIPGTHAVDLVNDILRKRKGINPRGWREFSRQLTTLNTPQDLVGNPDRWNWMVNEEPSSTTDEPKLYASASHLPTPETTPSPSKKKKKKKGKQQDSQVSSTTWTVYK